MKNIINSIRLLCVLFALTTSKNSLAQCASTFSFVTGPGGTATFVANPVPANMGEGYIWSVNNGATQTAMGPGSETFTTTFASDGIYSVVCTFTIPGTCGSTSTQTLLVNNAGCNLNANFSVQTTTVAGLMGFLGNVTGANPGANIGWFFGDGASTNAPVNFTGPNTATHTYSNTGNYTVTMIVMNNPVPGGPNCNSSYTAVITVTNAACVANSNFTIVPTPTPQVWNVTPADPAPITAAQWNWGDGSTSNTLYTSHSYSAAGMYTICLSVTVSCGASAMSCNSYSIYRSAGDQSIIQVNVVDPSVATGIDKGMANDAQYSIAPNPGKGVFSVQVNGLTARQASISVFNVAGRKVYAADSEVLNGSLMKELDLKGMAEGVYFIRVEAGSQSLSKKVIIQQ